MTSERNKMLEEKLMEDSIENKVEEGATSNGSRSRTRKN